MSKIILFLLLMWSAAHAGAANNRISAAGANAFLPTTEHNAGKVVNAVLPTPEHNAGSALQAGPGFPESSVTTFIFIHCAETTGNDEKLSATGHEQAGALTAFLSDMEVAAVYAPFKNCLVETVQPLASAQHRKVEYFRDATTEAPDAMKHILGVMMEKHKGKTIVICAPAASIRIMAGMLGIKEKTLKAGRGTFNEVLLVNVWWFGEAVAQKLNMNFQKKV